MTQSLKKFATYCLSILQKSFPDAHIELSYNKQDPWQLLVAVCLSAQSTDKKVNEVTPALFNKFKTINNFANADVLDLEAHIKILGLYKNKAKNLKLAAQQILTKFNGQVPNNRADLETLAGVGKKSSAVIVANAFNIPAIAVDTHVARISQRLGLSQNTNPDKIEEDLSRLWPSNLWLSAHHTLIFHGRRICFARKPNCLGCPLNNVCPKN